MTKYLAWASTIIALALSSGCAVLGHGSSLTSASNLETARRTSAQIARVCDLSDDTWGDALWITPCLYQVDPEHEGRTREASSSYGHWIIEKPDTDGLFARVKNRYDEVDRIIGAEDSAPMELAARTLLLVTATEFLDTQQAALNQMAYKPVAIGFRGRGRSRTLHSLNTRAATTIYFQSPSGATTLEVDWSYLMQAVTSARPDSPAGMNALTTEVIQRAVKLRGKGDLGNTIPTLATAVKSYRWFYHSRQQRKAREAEELIKKREAEQKARAAEAAREAKRATNRKEQAYVARGIELQRTRAAAKYLATTVKAFLYDQGIGTIAAFADRQTKLQMQQELDRTVNCGLGRLLDKHPDITDEDLRESANMLKYEIPLQLMFEIEGDEKDLGKTMPALTVMLGCEDQSGLGLF